MIEVIPLASSSKGNCYYITDGSSPLLIDPGIKFDSIREQLNFKVSDIQAVLCSHEHNDHCKAVLDLTKAGIDCYMSQGTKDELNLESHRINIIQAKQQFKVGPWTILPLDVKHDAKEPLAFLIAHREGYKILYATDTYYLKYTFTGLTHILIECNYSQQVLNENVSSGLIPIEQKKRTIRSHMSLETVKDFMRANDLSKVQEIWLLHLSSDNSHAQIFKQEVQKVTGKMVFLAE